MPIEERIAKFAASRWVSGWYALYTRHQCEEFFVRPCWTRDSAHSCHNIVLFTLGRTVARNSSNRFSPIMCSFEVASTEC
jgi:hypothetical protein